jgi:lipoprotein Spr
LNTKALLVIISLLITLGACRSTKDTGKDKSSSPDRVKTAQKLGVLLPDTYDKKLANSLADWIGTSYRYGGDSKAGTDCSGMVMAVYAEVYQLKLEHNAERQKVLSRKIREGDQKQGDLVFFSISSKKTDHVGIYLWDGYFVHASSKKGVIVSRLSEPYYRKTFTGAGTYLH